MLLLARHIYIRGHMKKFFVVLVSSMLLSFVPSDAKASPQSCSSYTGRNYIICAESGPENMPNGLPPGRRHGRKSTASGPCGFLAATRRVYGGDTLHHCTLYMEDRYGSWNSAYLFHRRNNFW